MKRFIILLGIYGNSQILPSEENYVYSRIYLEPTQESDFSKKQIGEVNYYDGLGRPKQNIVIKGSPRGNDIAIPVEYDEFGRQIKDYLPIPQVGTQNGSIYINPLFNASAAYGNEKIYAEKLIEKSPLDRVLGQIQVGNDWQNNPTKISYEVNIASDKVKKFITNTVWENGATKSVLEQDEYFDGSDLYKTINKDEDDNEQIEFKNGLGQVILYRKINEGNNIDTYYVYNEYQQLAFVIPPLASDKTNLISEDIDLLCYQYRYDGKGRLVEKKLPNKGWEYLVYDQQDRLVMSQDANLRAKRQWLFTKYDEFGRIAYTGIAIGGARQVEQNNINHPTRKANNVERKESKGITKNGLDIYYSDKIGTSSYPIDIQDILSVNYYDEYPLDSPVQPQEILGQKVLGQEDTKSLLLAQYIKNIENHQWTKSYTYYDGKGRIIGTNTQNHLGGYTRIEQLLDFTGVVQSSLVYHRRTAKDTEVRLKERYEYDHHNRLLKQYHQVNDDREELLVENIYDELGRVKMKKVGGVDNFSLQEIEYDYNIRGWLTRVNNAKSLEDKLFGYEIKYQNPERRDAEKKYNGNISEIDWQSSQDRELRRYTYHYDNLDRLKRAKYSKPNATIVETSSYDEYLEYDANGNITNLHRFGGNDNIAIKIDELEYNYEGNQLIKVIDSSQNSDGYPLGRNAIGYDSNGNMVNHLDKGINKIDNNLLNLPSRIIQVKGTTSYVYRADGIKVNKIYKNKTIDYLDGFQYENGVLQFVPTAEGYYDFVGGRYVYNYTDHLGNVRLSYAQNKRGETEIIDENNYYPFGMRHSGYNEVTKKLSYKYGFQGQERQDETGLLSFKWRNYDPTFARFFNVDPLSEKFPYNSIYAFQENKMGLGIELEGLELLKNNTGFFAIRGNEVLVKKAPATQRDALGNPRFTAGHIGLTSKGYFPNMPRIVNANTGFILDEYKYNGPTPNLVQMQDTSDNITGKDRQKFRSLEHTQEIRKINKAGSIIDGINELSSLTVLAINIPNVIKDTSKYVQASKDIKLILEQAKTMDKAINIVDKSGIDMNKEMRNNMINYIFDGTLPSSGLMPNSNILHNAWRIMEENGIPIQSLEEQIRKKNFYEEYF